MYTDKIGPVSLLNKKYNIKIENRNEVTINDCQENIVIFTDVSKNEIWQTGYGITFSEEEVMKYQILFHHIAVFSKQKQ